MPQLIIIRGLPGAGKSTFAETNFSSFMHVEADQYFMKDGEYKWDKTKLHIAHSYCWNKVRLLLDLGLNVVVSNTFVTKRDIVDYLEFENIIHGLEIAIFELHTQYGNIHNVSEETVNKMKDKWQQIPIYWKYQPNIIG